MDAIELKAWRSSLELTQVQAAAKLGIGRRSLIRYELGELPIPPEVDEAARGAKLPTGVVAFPMPEPNGFKPPVLERANYFWGRPESAHHSGQEVSRSDLLKVYENPPPWRDPLGRETGLFYSVHVAGDRAWKEPPSEKAIAAWHKERRERLPYRHDTGSIAFVSQLADKPKRDPRFQVKTDSGPKWTMQAWLHRMLGSSL